MLFWLVVGGPDAVAVQLVQERDEWVLGGEGEEDERKRAVETDGNEGEREDDGRGERPYVDE